MKNKNGYIALKYLILYDKIEFTKCLIENNINMAKYLISQNAIIHTKNGKNNTLFHSILKNDSNKVTKILEYFKL